eukprot:ctg_880.g370
MLAACGPASRPYLPAPSGEHFCEEDRNQTSFFSVVTSPALLSHDVGAGSARISPPAAGLETATRPHSPPLPLHRSAFTASSTRSGGDASVE